MDQPVVPHDLLIALLQVQAALERRSENFFQAYGLTAAQFNILNLLGLRGGRMDQAELVDLLLVGKSSTSIVLNRMVRDGLVQREDHPRDRRQVVLALTTKGKGLWRKIAPRYEAGVDEAFGALPAPRRRRFLEDLKTIHDTFAVQEGRAPADERWISRFRSAT